MDLQYGKRYTIKHETNNDKKVQLGAGSCSSDSHSTDNACLPQDLNDFIIEKLLTDMEYGETACAIIDKCDLPGSGYFLQSDADAVSILLSREDCSTYTCRFSPCFRHDYEAKESFSDKDVHSLLPKSRSQTSKRIRSDFKEEEVFGTNTTRKRASIRTGPKYGCSGGVFGHRYGASESPEATNAYLAAIMNPFNSDQAAIPDLNMSPLSMQTNELNYQFTWQGGTTDQIMLVFNPASTGYPVSLYHRPASTGLWYFLASVDTDDPLPENFRAFRLVSAGIAAKCAALPGGTYSLAGTFNSARVTTQPSYSDITYNSLISYASDSGSVVRQSSADEGVVMLWRPNGPHDVRVPETDAIINYSDTLTFSDFKNGHVATGTEEFSTIVLPTIFSGKISITAQGNYSKVGIPASSNLVISIGYRYRVSSVTTWTPVVGALDFAPNWREDVPTTSWGSFTLEVPPTDLVGVTEVYLKLSMIAGDQLSMNTRLTVNLHSYYQSNYMHPADVMILTGFTTGTPISISAALNYEVVADANLSRYVKSSYEVEDPLAMEMAEAYLKTVGNGLNMHYTIPAYNRYLNSMNLTGKALYGAAGPSLKAKLRQLWNAVSPSLAEAAKVGMRGVLVGGAGAVNPSLVPVANALSNSFLTAGVPGNRNLPKYSCSGPSEDISKILMNTGGAASIIAGGKPQFTSTEIARGAFFPLVSYSDTVTDTIGTIMISGYIKPSLPSTDTGEQVALSWVKFSFSSIDFFVAEHLLNESCTERIRSILQWAAESEVCAKGTYYIFTDRYYDISGPSHTLALLVAISGGASSNCVYTGIPVFTDGIIAISEVTQLPRKAVVANKFGKILVCPQISSQNVAEQDALQQAVSGLIVKEDAVCSGRTLKGTPVVYMVLTYMACLVVSARSDRAVGKAAATVTAGVSSGKLADFKAKLERLGQLMPKDNPNYTGFQNNYNNYLNVYPLAGDSNKVQIEAAMARKITAMERMIDQIVAKRAKSTASTPGQMKEKTKKAREAARKNMSEQEWNERYGQRAPSEAKAGKRAKVADSRERRMRALGLVPSDILPEVRKEPISEKAEETSEDFITADVLEAF